MADSESDSDPEYNMLLADLVHNRRDELGGDSGSDIDVSADSGSD